MLPIPATFVIDQDGVVRGAFVEPDVTIRQEESDILNNQQSSPTWRISG